MRNEWQGSMWCKNPRMVVTYTLDDHLQFVESWMKIVVERNTLSFKNMIWLISCFLLCAYYLQVGHEFSNYLSKIVIETDSQVFLFGEGREQLSYLLVGLLYFKRDGIVDLPLHLSHFNNKIRKFQNHLQIKIIIKVIKWCSKSERDLLWVLQNLFLKNGTIFLPTLFMKIKCTSWQRKRFQVCKFYFLIQDIYLSLANTLPVHTIDVTAFY